MMYIPHCHPILPLGSPAGRHRTVSFGPYSRSSSYQRELSHSGGATPSGLPAMGDDHNWLWGVTGEQEWTPEMKTGVHAQQLYCHLFHP